MGVLDKFLDMMKLSDEEDYEDDFFDGEEEEEDFVEEKPKKSFFKKEKTFEEEEEENLDYAPEKKVKNTRVVNNNKVTPMRQPSRRTASMEVCVIKPTTMENSREITETLLSGRTVILNLEGLDLEVAQRIIDFTSGATFAINGNLQKISNYIFLVTPTDVDISGDLQDLLNTSFDVPSINSRY